MSTSVSFLMEGYLVLFLLLWYTVFRLKEWRFIMDIQTVKPTGDRVLLQLIKASYKQGLILDPLAGERKTPFAKVVSQGEGVERDLVGKTVLYDIHEGFRLDDDHLFMEEKFLTAVLEEEEYVG